MTYKDLAKYLMNWPTAAEVGTIVEDTIASKYYWLGFLGFVPPTIPDEGDYWVHYDEDEDVDFQGHTADYVFRNQANENIVQYIYLTKLV